MRMTKAICAMAASIMLAGYAAGAECKIVANSSVEASSVSKDEIKAVFLLTKTALEGSGHVEPVLAKGGAAHDAFLKDVVGKSDSALQTYYRSLVFTGKAAMPKAVGGDAAVIAYVAKTKGAIGYVSAGADTAGVKTLDIK